MTQEELAEALNVSLEHLSKMERGKRKPSIDLIVAMACYFHVSTDYLLMRKDHDKVDSRTKLLDVVAQLAESQKAVRLTAMHEKASSRHHLQKKLQIRTTRAGNPYCRYLKKYSPIY